MTDREKEFLKTMIEIGMALNKEAMTTVSPDDGRCLRILVSPESGWVNASFIKDGICKEANRFDQFPEIDYREVDIRDLDI